MAYTTINKPTDYFNTKLYTGTGSSQTITGVGFQPDFTWIKLRSGADSHSLEDAVRGANKHLRSDTTSAEAESGTAHITSWNSDGFVLGSGDGQVNGNSSTYVSWNWLGANGTTSNSDGSITSTVSANTTAGFSIVSYTGTGSATTVGHGLGVAPAMAIVKDRDSTYAWYVYHQQLSGASYYLALNGTGAESENTAIYSSAPTSTVMNIGNHGGINGSGTNYIMYCFAEKTGYSKFGKYTANAAVDGTFIYTGFKPAFVFIKSSNSAQAGQDWFIYDSVRDSGNAATQTLQPNTNSAEETNVAPIDILSNGFKLRTNTGRINGTNGEYIYMSFAEAPLVGGTGAGVPCTAR